MDSARHELRNVGSLESSIDDWRAICLCRFQQAGRVIGPFIDRPAGKTTAKKPDHDRKLGICGCISQPIDTKG